MGILDWFRLKPSHASQHDDSAPDGRRESPSTVDPRLVALATKYMTMDYPRNAFDDMLATLTGGQTKRPIYSVSWTGKVQRASESVAGMGSPIDMKIVQVAACLKGRGDVNLFDPHAIARAAMEAIQHYAALPKVRQFFLAPYESRRGVLAPGKLPPADEQCRILAGVELLLLEIYESLPYDGSIITDSVVEEKIDQLIKSRE